MFFYKEIALTINLIHKRSLTIFFLFTLLFSFLIFNQCDSNTGVIPYEATYDLTDATGNYIDTECSNPQDAATYVTPSFATIANIEMGAIRQADTSIDFRFFAPTATSVELLLYSNASTSYLSPSSVVTMTRDANNYGIWEKTGVTTAKAISDGGGYSYYRYRINCMKPYDTADPMKESERYILDPYSRASVGATGPSIIIDPKWVETDPGAGNRPEGWDANDYFTGWTDYNDAADEWFDTTGNIRPKTFQYIIYETHVADITGYYNSPAGSGQAPLDGEVAIDIFSKKAGKYLGMQEAISHLTDLGINAVELMPLHEFAVDSGSPEDYSWGYLPVLLFAPESSYSTDATSGKQVTELKALINELHKNKIAVILDVVLNHTSNKYNYLYHIDPSGRYYFRTNGTEWENVGTGNKIYDDKTARPFAYKLLLDNIKYWLEEFHVDGFRFDLAVGTQETTLRDIQDMINGDASASITTNVTDGSTTTDNFGNTILLPNVMTAENWLGADRHSFMVQSDWTSPNFIGQISSDYRGFSQWNDFFRESVKAFINGDSTTTVTDRTKNAVYFTESPGETREDGLANVGSLNPVDTINYIESHDEATIANVVMGSNAKAALGALVLLTSHGIPMLYQGQEFMRSKAIQDQSVEGNLLDWSLKTTNQDFFQFLSFLTKLRKNCSAFQYGEDPDIGNSNFPSNSGAQQGEGTYQLWTQGGACSSVFGTKLDGKTEFKVVVNSSSSYKTFTIETSGSSWEAIASVGGNCSDYTATFKWYGGSDEDVTTDTDEGDDYEISGWGASTDNWGLSCRSAVILVKQ